MQMTGMTDRTKPINKTEPKDTADTADRTELAGRAEPANRTDPIDMTALIRTALEMRVKAYAPYSHFQVGAALLAGSGKIYTGCNIENASYGATNCGERTAFFKAVSEGERSFSAIAIAGGLEGMEPEDYAYPCGICRQVMKEFCSPDFKIIVAKSQEDFLCFTLAELLPHGFGGESILDF